MLRSYIITNTPIPTEIEEGNVEYKQRLDQKDKNKIRKMSSQMVWRLQEGFNNNGKLEAHYFLGIKDNGQIASVDENIINSSIDILKEVCTKCQAEIMNIDKIVINQSQCVAEVIVCKKAIGNFIKESRVCFLGTSGHGKTTLISHLTFNQLDNGNGLARSLVLKHTHELNSGVTSSIKHDIIGLKNNKIINYKTELHCNWEKIVLTSDKIIGLTDLPGKSKFYKTTLYGILSLKPHFNIINISPSECLVDNIYILDLEIINSIKICIVTNIPFFIVFTKCDILEPDNDLINIINNIVNKFKNINIYDFHKTLSYDSINIPYICISNVNNNNFNYLYSLLDIYSDHYNNNLKIKYNDVEFIVHDSYIIPDRGNIVYGIQNKGSINVNETYYIGPINNEFLPVTIRTIHKKQIDSKSIYQDESASIEIKLQNQIDSLKNLIIVKNNIDLYTSDHFTILLLENNNILKINSQYTIFYDNIIESIIITQINNNFIEAYFAKRHNKLIKKNNICIIKETFNNNIILGKFY